VPGREGASRLHALESAHRAQSGFEPAVIGFDDIVRVLLEDVPCGRHELVDDPRVDRCPVGGDLDRSGPESQRAGEERPGGRTVAALGQQDVDDLAVLIDRAIEISPAAGDLGVRVGSGRGAVSVFRLVRFLGPPAEPDVPVPEHPALHKSVPLGQAAVIVAVHGSGILEPR
jgi:hypothetical protein